MDPRWPDDQATLACRKAPRTSPPATDQEGLAGLALAALREAECGLSPEQLARRARLTPLGARMALRTLRAQHQVLEHDGVVELARP